MIKMKVPPILYVILILEIVKGAKTATTPAPINCDLDSDKTLAPGCPFRFFLAEIPVGDCSLEREWCMLVRYSNFAVTQGTNTCR